MATLLKHLDIVADLECELDGHALSIRSAEGTTVVDFPNLSTGIRLARLAAVGEPLRASLQRWKRFLDVSVHRLEIRIQGRPLASLGHDTGSGLWRIFGLPSIRLDPWTLFSEIRRRS